MATRKKQGTGDNPRRMYATYEWSEPNEYALTDSGTFECDIACVTEGGTHHIIVLEMNMENAANMVGNVFRFIFKKWHVLVLKKLARYTDVIGEVD